MDSDNTIRAAGEGGFSQSGRPGDVFITVKVCENDGSALACGYLTGGIGLILTICHRFFRTRCLKEERKSISMWMHQLRLLR